MENNAENVLILSTGSSLERRTGRNKYFQREEASVEARNPGFVRSHDGKREIPWNAVAGRSHKSAAGLS